MTKQISNTNNLLKESLIDSISDSLIATDLEGKIIYWNKAAEKLYKWKSQEVIGKNILEVTPSTITKKQAAEIMNSLRNGDSWEGEFEVQDKNGKTFPVHVKDSPLLDSKGNLIGIIGSSNDISSFKEVEIKLKEAREEAEESKKQLETIFNMSQMLICIADINTSTFKFINPTFEKILGYSKEELLTKPFTEFIHPDDVKPTTEVIEKQLQAGIVVQTFENRYLCKNGKYCWLNWNSYPIPEKGIAYAIAHDITTRKLEEVARRESDERYRIAQDMSPDGFTILKPVRNKKGHVVDFVWVYENNAVARMNGTDPHAVIGKRLLELFPGHSDTQFFKAYIAVAESGKSITLEDSYIGETIDKVTWFRIVVVPMDENIAILSQDISERKNAENELKESKEKLSLIVNKSPFPVTIVDTNDEKIIYWSESATALTGYSVKTEAEWFKLAYPDEKYRKQVIERWKHFLEKARESNEAINTGEYRITCKNGSVKDVVLYAQFIPGNLVVTINDITERKHAETRIKTMAEMLTFAPNAITVCDYNGNFLYANQKTLDIFGYTWEEFKAIPLSKLDTPETAAQTPARIEEIRKKGEGRFEVESFKKDGSIVPMEIHVKTTKWDNVDALITVASDITERKQMEEEILKNQLRYQKAQAIGNVGNWEYDLVTSQFWGSEESRKIFGFNPKPIELTTDRVESCITERIRVHQALLDLITHGKKYDLVYEILTEDKGIQKIIHSIAELEKDAQGNPIKITGVINDITRQKKIEDDLIIAKEKAEESDRLKSAFLANMSHEIRTPMNGILGFTNLLQEHDLTGEEQNQYIEIIQKSGKRMLNTVNDIIEISKIDSGQIKVASNMVNVSEHLLTLHKFFKLEAEKKGLKLNLNNKLSEDESLILCDENKLGSILTNLIKNAIKFTEKGTIEIGCKKNKKFLELYVEDSGIGIPANRKEAIFNRFEQADVEDQLVHEGSGLGLAISKSYVELLGGKMWVDSEQNKGSTFFFSIPYDPTNTETKIKVSGKKQVENKEKKLNILIVEDDDVSSMLLSTILNDKAKNIQIATNGLKAVEICKNSTNFDLILMDIKLPGIDGLEATKRIREFDRNVKIIAQTAYALEGDKEKAIEIGCNDYISKPISKGKLIEMIGKYI